jgi:hypothetical protein
VKQGLSPAFFMCYKLDFLLIDLKVSSRKNLLSDSFKEHFYYFLISFLSCFGCHFVVFVKLRAMCVAMGNPAIFTLRQPLLA